MKKIHILRMLASFILIAVLVQSVSGTGADIKYAQAAKKGLSKTKVTLVSGKTEQIKLKGDKIKAVKSDKKKVAGINKKGVISAKNIGKAKLTITGKSGKKYICKVTVKPGLNYNKKTLKVGESFKLTLNGAKVKKITSSNKSVASVKKSGKVTAHKAGSTIVKVLDTKKKKYVCRVTVTDTNVVNSSNDNNSNSTNNSNTNNSNNGNAANQTGNDYSVSINVDNYTKNYIETGDENYVLSGSVDTVGQISSVTCNCQGNIPVTGTARWTTGNIPLSIGYNTVTISVNMADGKKYDKQVNILRLSTSLKMSEDVVKYDIENADTLLEVKSINEEVLGTWTDGEEYNIAISNSNPLYKSITEGKIKKNEIIYIPANRYNPYDVSLRYLYSDDKCSDTIEGYDSEICEVIHTSETTLFDIYEGDVAITADSIDKDDPIAFVYSPYDDGEDEDELSAMDTNISVKDSDDYMKVWNAGVQKKNLSNFFRNGLNTYGLDGENGMITISGEVLIYDGDGNKDTTDDQVKMTMQYATTGLRSEFRYIHEDDEFLPREITGGLSWTDDIEVEFTWGKDIDMKDIVKKLNGGFDNSKQIKNTNWTVEGVDVSDTIFLGTIGIRLDKIVYNNFDDMIEEKVQPVLGVSVIVNLKGEAGIESSLKLSYDQYRESGVSIRNEDKVPKCDSIFKSNPTIERKDMGLFLGTFIIEEYSVSAESAEKLDKGPKAAAVAKLEGKASFSVGIGGAIYIMYSGIIPAMIRVYIGPDVEASGYVELELRNSEQRIPNEVQLLNTGWYCTAKGNISLNADISLNCDIRVKVKAHRDGIWKKEYDLELEPKEFSLELLSLGMSFVNLNGHVNTYELDENDNVIDVPIKGAKVSVHPNAIKSDVASSKQVAITDEKGYYEFRGFFFSMDIIDLEKDNTNTLTVEAEGYSRHIDNELVLEKSSDVEKPYDVTLKKGEGNLYGNIYGLRKDEDTEEIIREPLGGVLVSLYNNKGDLIANTYTESDGLFEFQDLTYGTYSLKCEKDNYITSDNSSIYIERENSGLTISMALIEENDEKGTVYGSLYDATDESLIESNLKMYIYKNYGEDGELVDSFVVNDGTYEVELEAGVYTVLVKDVNATQKYSDDIFYIEVVGGKEKICRNAYISPKLKKGKLRAILNWGDSPYDLDLHVVASGNNNYHLYWLDDYAEDEDTEEVLGELDLDETEADGPETITIYEQNDGVYHILVHDYTNRYETYSNELALSGAYVTIIAGDEDENIIRLQVPYKAGNLWDVCKYDSKTGEFILINQMRYIEDPDDIK